MNKHTLEALKKSIVKWEEKVEAKTPRSVNMSSYNCPLCVEDTLSGRDSCKACPVMAATGEIMCSGTPYGNAYKARDKWKMGFWTWINKRKWQKAARAEVDFLKSLLPKES